MNLVNILEVYFTKPEQLNTFLQNIERDTLISCLSELIDRYANDVNSSGLRELFTLIKVGYKSTVGKLGYNGKRSDGMPCDVKPINIRSESGNKLNGGGNFSDFTYERFNRYLGDGVMMLVSGFIDGHLVYILEFPFSDLEPQIRHQLDRFFTKPRRPGEYLRSASFSFIHYKDSLGLKIIYKAPNIENFQQFLTRQLFDFLRGKQWRTTQLF